MPSRALASRHGHRPAPAHLPSRPRPRPRDSLQPIAKLSGGQKARVVFAAISLANAHILLLDEPTNHLDMQV